MKRIAVRRSELATPKAHYYELYDCGTPGHTHLLAFDVDDQPMVDITIAHENLPTFIDALDAIWIKSLKGRSL